MLATIEPVVSYLQRLGYANRTHVYGFDESLTGQRGCDMGAAVKAVFGAVKKRFPHVTTATAGFGYRAWGQPPDAGWPLDMWASDYFTYCWNDTDAHAVAACVDKQTRLSQWRRHHQYWWVTFTNALQFWPEPGNTLRKPLPRCHHDSDPALILSQVVLGV
jgi:hypothetical protein